MYPTTLPEKIIPSIINAGAVIILATPFLFARPNFMAWRFILIAVFFSYTLFFLIFFKNRCLGMMIMHTYWDTNYKFTQHLTYDVLYSLSFASLIIWLWFPFDLFIINMLLFQLPILILKKTTLHGLISGNLKTIK